MKENTTDHKKEGSGWTPQEIREAIESAGLSQRSIAAAHGMTPQAIGQTIQGTTCGRLARRAVAESLGISITDIWPDALLPLRERRLRMAS